ncbi:MAG: hypothetical protein ACI9FN_002087 [Saprospiraceae bacterium]|jgi:hypothetical protein
MKKKFVLRIDEKTMASVEKWAADEFRSVNGQLEWMITKILKENKRLQKRQDTKSDDIVDPAP